MRVLLLTEFFPAYKNGVITGGVESRDYYLAGELARNGHKVIIVTSLMDNSPRYERRANVEIYRVGPKRNYTQTGQFINRFAFFREMIRISGELEFDVIDANSASVYLAAWIISKLDNRRLVYWIPDIQGFIPTMKYLGYVVGFAEALFEQVSIFFPPDLAIALSRSTAAKLPSFFYSGKTQIIYPGIKLTVLKRRNHFPLKNIITIQRLSSYKRADLLIKALAELRKSNKNLTLTVIGTGSEKDRLKNLTKSLNLENNVRFLENLPHQKVLKELEKADIFSLPSEIEGFGIVTLEAMSRGLPFVNSDITVHREIAKLSGGGLLFRNGNASDLAKKIGILVDQRKTYQELSTSAFRFAKNHSLDGMTAQTLEAYKLEENKRICMVTDAWAPVWGGGQEHIWQISQILVKKYGYNIDIVVPNISGKNKFPKIENYLNGNLRVIRIGKEFSFPNLLGRINYFLALCRYVLKYKYEIYHSHSFSSSLVLPLVRLFRRGKIAFTLHGAGVDLLGGGLLNKLPVFKYLSSLIISGINYDFAMTAAKSSVSGVKQKYIFVGNGVNTIDFERIKVKKNKKTPVILWVGRLDPVKGLDLLFQAVSKLTDLGDFRIKIVGSGPIENELKKTARRLGIGRITEFLGPTFGRNKIREYKSADIFVLPSLSEGLPLTILEAMTAGLPVIASRVGDIPDLVRNGENGYLIRAGDTEELSEAISLLVKNRRLREQMGTRGREKVLRYFTWDKAAARVLKVFSGIK